MTTQQLKDLGYVETKPGHWHKGSELVLNPLPESRKDILSAIKTYKATNCLLNKTEYRYCFILEARGLEVLKQAITLRLDPPYKSYKPDLAYLGQFGLTFVEVKAKHRFYEKGVAKAALAAKTYPQFRFELAVWENNEWRETVLSP